jgi:CDP-Glycerol:Poly(glycerophosphate) glycerophosphotransferase
LLTLTAATLAEVLRIWALMARDKLARKKVVILFVEELGMIQFTRPVHDELARRAGGRIAFYIASEYAESHEHLDVFGVPAERRFHPRLARAFLLADVFLSASVYGKGPRASRRIHIGHGQPSKVEVVRKECLENYDVYLLAGPLQRDQFEHMFERHGLDMSKFRLVDVGYPKSDALLQGRYQRASVLARLGLDPTRKTVLYAPAWDPGGSLRSFGEEVIEQLLSVEGANIIVKLHPVSHTPRSSSNYEFYTGGVNWTERFRKYESNPSFRHVTDSQVDPLLVAADLLVTDFSSVALEFVVLDRPIIYIDCPEYFEKTLKLPYYESDPEYVKTNPRANAGRHVGVVVEHVEGLGAAAADALANPSLNSDKRRMLASMLLYNPGRGSEVAAGEILRLLGLNREK